MAKKVYRRKPAAPKKEKLPKKPFPWKKVLLLFLSFVVFFTLYQVGIHFYQLWVLHAYCISAGVLALTYGVWNRGLFRVPKPEELPKEWKREEKDAFIEGVTKRKKQSSVLLYILIPLILTVFFDTVYLFLTNTMGYDL